MGVWGTAIFSDDTARDVREEYRDLISEGLTSAEATERLLVKWSASLNDPDEASSVWLGLAATQWKLGRLEPNVLQKALEVIDNGSDLGRWEAGSRDYRKRQTVLQKLKTQLTSPQPRPKPVPKRFRNSNEWQSGDLICYQLLSGKKVILRVIGHHRDKGGDSPVCELLDWMGDELPQESRLASLPTRKPTKDWKRPQLMIGRIRASQRPDARLENIGVNLEPSQTPGRYRVILWPWLDRVLKEDFGFE